MAGRDHTAKFILLGEDKTRAAVASARREFGELKKTVFSLQGALAGGLLGYGIKESIQDLVNAKIDMQRVHFTLEAALGSSQAATREFGFLSKTANELGTNLREGAKGFGLLAASAQATHIPIQTIERLYTGLSKQFTILHSSTDKQNRALLALDEIMSMGVAHSRQLRRQLSMALAGSGLLPKLMDKLGMNPHQFEKAMKSDELTARRIIPAIASVLNDVNPTALHDATHSLNSELNRLHNTIFTMENNVGSHGFLSGIKDAIVQLTNTLKDPEVQAGLGDLASDLGTILSDAARFGAAAAGGLDLFTKALTGLTSAETAPLHTGKTLADQAKIAKQEMQKLAPVINNIEHPGMLSDQSLRNLVDYGGQKKRLQGLLAMYHNYARQLVQIHALEKQYGPGASFLNPTSSLMTNLVGQIQKAYTKANPAGKKLPQATVQRIKKIVEGLQKEAATYGLTADQLKIYELRQMGASASDIKAAKAAIAARAAKKQQATEAKAHAKALSDEKKALDGLASSLEAEMDPLRRYKQEQMQLDIALQEHRISPTQYVRFSAQVQADMAKVRDSASKTNKSLNQFSVQAAHNLQDILGQSILDVFQGKGNVMQNFVHSFAQSIQQMIAQLLALKAATALFGKDFATGKSNNVGGLLGGLFSTLFSTKSQRTGGMVGAPSAPTVSVPAMAFAGAPHFSGGGFPGLAPDAVPIIAHKGEEVLTKGDPRNALNGGHRPAAMNVTINAQGAGPDETAKIARFGGDLQRMWRGDFDHKKAYGDWPT